MRQARPFAAAAPALMRLVRRKVVGPHVSRASWSLIDQGIVSLGTFGVNIVLARNLPQAEYGTFALVFWLLLFLQVFNTTLIFYPFTIQVATPGANRVALIWSSMALLAAAAVPLAVVAALVLLVLGHAGDLIAWVLLWFLFWQLQEALRRILFAEFRHRSAILGDAMSYIGQVVAVIFLVHYGMLTLPRIFAALALTSAVAAAIQSLQIGASWSRPRQLRSLAQEYWSLGGWSLASSLATALRVGSLLWLLAIVASRNEVAELQAALNIVGLINPIIHGLGNIIPQATARAYAHGASSAWRAARPYIWLGLGPTVAYYAFVMINPGLVLTAFYGSQSPYGELVLSVQILSAAFVFNYLAEMVCSFLHGVRAARAALNINLLGTLLVILLVIPLVGTLGVTGVCVALALSAVLRLALSYDYLRRQIGGAHVLV